MVECKLVLTRSGATTTTGAAVYSWAAGWRARLKLNAHCTGIASGTQTYPRGLSVQARNPRWGATGSASVFVDRRLARNGRHQAFKNGKSRRLLEMAECKLVSTRPGSTTTTGAALYSSAAGWRARLKLNAHCTGKASATRFERVLSYQCVAGKLFHRCVYNEPQHHGNQRHGD
jgi:hypothetical protein